MSDKRTKMRQRRQRYHLHHRRLRGEKRGVSPVVATLILILIAVAAAAALYLWLVVWQGNLTKSIGTTGPQATLTIGGSTSVYPFSSLAVTWFEQNNSDVVISDNQGGTGAGMVAVCEGNVDLGASSTPQTVSTLETSYGCSSTYASTIQIETIAYDAVDVAIASSNPHGLLGISADTLNDIYEAASTTSPSALIGSMNGEALPSGFVTYNTPLLWDQIPACGALAIGVTTGCAGATLADTGYSFTTAGALGTHEAVCNTDDLCDATAEATSCGWSVCAGGATSAAQTAPIVAVERLDASGTTQTFEAKLLGYGSGANSNAKQWAGISSSATAQTSAGAFANLGYAGCGGNNLLSDCGITLATADQGTGNPGVAAIIAANTNAIGYLSDGIARTYSGIGSAGIVPFAALGQGVGGAGLPQGISVSSYASGGVIATTGTTGTIAAGLTSSAATNNYAGGRPFELISLEPLTGVAQEFLTFITDPAVNTALASATAEVGLYSVVP